MAFFQFDVIVEIGYEVVKEMEEDKLSDLDEAKSLYLAIQTIDIQNTLLIRKIHNENKLLGELLKGFNKKINLLSRLANWQEGQQLRQKVYLGVEGISFKVSENLPINTKLKLKILFPSNFDQLYIVASILEIKAISNDEYKAHALFHNLTQEEEDIIVQHILEAERQYIRNKSDISEEVQK